MNLLFISFFIILFASMWFIRVEIKKLYKIIYEIRKNMPDKLREEEEKIGIRKKYYSTIKENSYSENEDKFINQDLNKSNEFDEIMSSVVTDDKVRKKITEIYKNNKK